MLATGGGGVLPTVREVGDDSDAGRTREGRDGGEGGHGGEQGERGEGREVREASMQRAAGTSTVGGGGYDDEVPGRPGSSRPDGLLALKEAKRWQGLADDTRTRHVIGCLELKQRGFEMLWMMRRTLYPIPYTLYPIPYTLKPIPKL